MMWKTNRYAYASALPAIAAALALSSTPAWSQEVTPPTAEPTPVTSDPLAPADTAPVTTDTTVTDPAPVVETTTTETTATAPAKPKAKPAPAKATHTVAAKKPTATRVASTAPAAAPAAAAPAATPVAEAAPAAPQPIVDARPQADAQQAPETAQSNLKVDETTMMLGGGALALLALGGGAFALSRRRKHRDDEEFVEETAMDEPMAAEPAPMPRHDVIHEEQPAIIAPSAFAWGNAQPADQHVESDRQPGETWVERAHRGPTPDNPSLSLRKRLKRAAFFDAREERVEAGKAEPIEADAGLPESAVEMRERELELA